MTYALRLALSPDSESQRRESKEIRSDCLGQIVLDAVGEQDVVKEKIGHVTDYQIEPAHQTAQAPAPPR